MSKTAAFIKTSLFQHLCASPVGPFQIVFPNTIWNGLLAVEVFPKCVYVTTVDSRITVFTMHVFCCIFAMVFHLYFVVLRELVGAVT